MKRITTIVLAIVMIAAAACQPFSYTGAKASTTDVKKAYKKYCKDYGRKNEYYSSDSYYQLFDFNKDGIKEMVITYPGGARSACYVYTYYKGKVIPFSSKKSECLFFNNVTYLKNKNYMIGYGSGGYQDYTYEIYKISNGKFKYVGKYACESGKFKRNGKKIAKGTMEKFEKKLKYPAGKSYKF